MDIHRCRFVPYPPSTINALAFSHPHISRSHSKKTSESLRLAIGRANGDIEIWNPLKGAWLQETILRGGKDRSVDGLVWIQDPDELDAEGKVIEGKLRLFSIGYTTTVTEWDVEKGKPLRQSSGNHGEIWCMAAQPRMDGSQRQDLVTGCTDGAVVLYSTEDDDLQLQRVLVRPSTKKAKIISLTFQNRTTVIAGCTDSTIRIMNIQNGSIIRSMSLGAGPSGGPKEIIVWTVKCLPDGTIVSGDSTGELRIWDGKLYTLKQRIKSHRQDILSMATSTDGSSIFTGGMDRRTTVYKQVGQGLKQRWAEISHRRYHDHDVKTMATFEGKGLSVVVSGGPDARPIVVPLKEFGLENQRALPHLPQSSVIQSSATTRLVMSWWDREVHIWRVKKDIPGVPDPESDSESETRSIPKARKLVAKILLKGEANITSASLSKDGTLLAVSTTIDAKIFKLDVRSASSDDSLKVTKLPVSKSVSGKGASMVQFSPDRKWLVVVRNEGKIIVFRTTSPEDDSWLHPHATSLARVDRNEDKFSSMSGLGKYNRKIHLVSFSFDGRILAVGDLAGYIDTWVLEGDEDILLPLKAEDTLGDGESVDSDSGDEESQKPSVVFGQHWAQNQSAGLIPRLPSTPVVMSFRPGKDQAKRISNGVSPHPTRHNPNPVNHHVPAVEDRLFVVTAGSVGTSSKVLEFVVLKGSLSHWSRNNPIANFPEEYKGLRDQAMGCVWDVADDKERVWIYGSSWLWMFDLTRDFPVYNSQLSLQNGDGEHEETSLVTSSRKRKRNTKFLSDKLFSHIDLRKGTSGAGSKVPDNELGTGMSRKMQRIIDGEEQEISRHNDEMDIDDDDDEDSSSDQPTRQRQLSTTEDIDNQSINGDAPKEGEPQGPPHWWHTFKYRPIMGIVPLGKADPETGLEVAIVERPIWEADLPPRYYGDQEWEKPGL